MKKTLKEFLEKNDACESRKYLLLKIWNQNLI